MVLIILLKSNWLESFSYPSLKIMETGGYSIFMSNSGNKDYINVGEKCLLYKLWDLNSETKCIEKSILNELLQQKLFIFGLIMFFDNNVFEIMNKKIRKEI